MATNENHLKLMFLLMLSCMWIFFAAARPRDTLKSGDTLNSSTHLVSANKAFTLGFFHSGSTNNIYLGIWFTNDPKKIVWVGNRNKPVVNTAAALTLEAKGNFEILPQGGDAIPLYAHQTTNYTYTPFATLLDSGNFVLQELDSNGTTQRVLWQSFDEPTDTLLPGMKLGVNHKNGRPWSLTSWLNKVVPVPGQFSLEWDPKGCQLIIRRQGVEFWTSGVLKGDKFEFISDESKCMYNFTVVSNEDGEHLVYNDINQGGQSAWFLSFEGNFLVLMDPILQKLKAVMDTVLMEAARDGYHRVEVVMTCLIKDLVTSYKGLNLASCIITLNLPWMIAGLLAGTTVAAMPILSYMIIRLDANFG